MEKVGVAYGVFQKFFFGSIYILTRRLGFTDYPGKSIHQNQNLNQEKRMKWNWPKILLRTLKVSVADSRSKFRKKNSTFDEGKPTLLVIYQQRILYFYNNRYCIRDEFLWCNNDMNNWRVLMIKDLCVIQTSRWKIGQCII